MTVIPVKSLDYYFVVAINDMNYKENEPLRGITIPEEFDEMSDTEIAQLIRQAMKVLRLDRGHE